jgi:hypothetical protein
MQKNKSTILNIQFLPNNHANKVLPLKKRLKRRHFFFLNFLNKKYYKIQAGNLALIIMTFLR